MSEREADRRSPALVAALTRSSGSSRSGKSISAGIWVATARRTPHGRCADWPSKAAVLRRGIVGGQGGGCSNRSTTSPRGGTRSTVPLSVLRRKLRLMPRDDLGSSLLAHLDWRGLLERWSREAVAHAEELRLHLTPDMRATGWIGRPPVSTSTLEAAERRLGRALPPSLRAFAAVTDGWPVLSMDYGELRRDDGRGWCRRSW